MRRKADFPEIAPRLIRCTVKEASVGATTLKIVSNLHPTKPLRSLGANMHYIIGYMREVSTSFPQRLAVLAIPSSYIA
jgi:hypothetical protein